MASGTEGMGSSDRIRNLERHIDGISGETESSKEPRSTTRRLGDHFKTLKNKVKASSFLTGVGVALLTLGAMASGGAALATPVGWTLLVGGACASAYFAFKSIQGGAEGKDVAKEALKNMALGFASPVLAVFAIYNAVRSEFRLEHNIPAAPLPDFPGPEDEFERKIEPAHEEIDTELEE